MYKRKGNFNRKGKSDWSNNTSYKDQFPSEPYKEGNVEDGISIKALSNLPKGSYSVKADPYSAALPSSVPYNILAKFLKAVGGNYAGENNIDGGNVQQYANAVNSKFLDYFDSFRMKIDLNYRYLPILKGGRTGKALVDEMRKSIAEALSVLQSTTYTNLAINNFAIETDLEMGSAAESTININNVDTKVYQNSTDVIYAMSIYYQIFLQEGLSVMNSHNSFRLKQGTAIRDAWGREVPNLNAFFGLMNKKAFLSLLDSINLSFEGEYVDTDFMKQVNYLTFMPSRRSNSITDPVLELQGKMAHPTIFKVHIIGNNGEYVDTIYDDAKLGLTMTVNEEATFVSYWSACDSLKDYLSLEATKRWARGSYTPGGIVGTDNARYNAIKSMFDVIIASFVYFKPQWSDFRECLDVMTRTGTISWTKGFRPSVTKDTDAPLFMNLIVDDIYKMVMSGNDKLEYNDSTKRWTTFTQWNMYTGIPEYDSKQGGAFITFSSKNYTGLATEDEQIDYLPLMFNTSPSSNGIYVVGISRRGKVANLTYDVVTISEDKVLTRLAPLGSQSSLQIRIPYLKYSDNTTLTMSERSTLYKTLTQIFGMAKIGLTATTTDTSLDPDIIAIYQIEICDITNEAITYSRANAPFRGTTSSQGLLGFFGVSK